MVAIVFSVGVFFLVKHPNFLQASVLNLYEIDMIKKNNRDIAYQQNQNSLDVFFNKQQVTVHPINIILARHPDLLVNPQQITSQCPFEVISNTQDFMEISIDCTDFTEQNSILTIPFSGDASYILVEEWYYTKNTTKQNLSIGNLSSLSVHGN